jgi:hypothetical protein
MLLPGIDATLSSSFSRVYIFIQKAKSAVRYAEENEKQAQNGTRDLKRIRLPSTRDRDAGWSRLYFRSTLRTGCGGLVSTEGRRVVSAGGSEKTILASRHAPIQSLLIHKVTSNCHYCKGMSLQSRL